MTVETTTARVQYATNGTTGPWTVPFYFLDDDHLQVIYTDEDGNETVLASSAYSITGAGVESGGTVTTDTAYVADGFITILRNIEPLQETDLVDGDSLPAETLETALDKLTMLIQQALEVVGRSLVFSPSDQSGSVLPSAAARASRLLGFDSDGVLSLNAPTDGTAAALALSLASSATNSDGAGMVGFDPELNYVVGTIGHREKLTVHTESFRSAGTDIATLEAAIAFAKTLTAPCLIVDGVGYTVSTTVTFDLPSNSTIQFRGLITSSVSDASAIVIGSTSANTNRLIVEGIKVVRTSSDTTGASVGVECRSLVWSKVDVRLITGFRDGLLVNGTSANGGSSHNDFHLGMLHDNRTNLRLTASGVGYCNEQRFYGGSFSHASGYPAVTTVNVQIDHFAANELNNNRFFGPSLEDNSTLAVAAVINGSNNVIYWPRIERVSNQSTYLIEFTADSSECSVEGDGFTLVNTNISDLGTNNSYATREGARINTQTADDATKAVLSLMSTTTTNARLLMGRDSSGVVQWFIRGNGQAVLRNLYLSNLGNYASDVAAAAGGVAIGELYHNSGAVRVRLT